MKRYRVLIWVGLVAIAVWFLRGGSRTTGGQVSTLELSYRTYAPGTYKLVLTKPMRLPVGEPHISVVPMADIGQAAITHEGKRKDTGRDCGGPVYTAIRDNGAVLYYCSKCKKCWAAKEKLLER